MKYLELFKNGFDETLTEKVKYENWPYIGYSPTEGFAFSIIPNEDGTMYTVYRVVKKDISNLTYNEVDLGLSVKWSDRNVGATSPEDFGSYFQWGDTEGIVCDGKSEITADQLASLLQILVGDEMEITADNVHDILTMEFGDDPGYDLSIFGWHFSIDKVFNWESYFDVDKESEYDEYGCPISFTKYHNNEGGLTVLESIDDAATIHMGSEWRMPTIEEIRELINNTTRTFVDFQGNEYSKEQAENDAISEGNLYGVRFTGSNGNSIFIPAAGICDRSFLVDTGFLSILWSSTLSEDISCGAGALHFTDGAYLEDGDYERRIGFLVRGVKKS